jgi:hypothetical protein
MSKHSKPGGDKPHPNHHNANTSEEKRNISGNIYVRGEITAISTPEETLTRKAAANKQETSDTKKRRIEYAMLAVVMLYTIFAGMQTCSTAGQLSEARKVTRFTDENFRASQRAWVGPDTIEIPIPVADKPIVWRMVLKNYGISPAMSLEIRNIAQLINAPKVNPTTAMFLPTMLPPHGTGETTTIFNGELYTYLGGVNLSLYPSQVEDVIQGRSQIVYYAEITYLDIFGQKHITHVCRVWNSLGAAACGFGEDAN